MGIPNFDKVIVSTISILSAGSFVANLLLITTIWGIRKKRTNKSNPTLLLTLKFVLSYLKAYVFLNVTMLVFEIADSKASTLLTMCQ